MTRKSGRAAVEPEAAGLGAASEGEAAAGTGRRCPKQSLASLFVAFVFVFVWGLWRAARTGTQVAQETAAGETERWSVAGIEGILRAALEFGGS